ncbi:MAG: hypothetical protein M3O61_18220 [Gemmatimonadota bacterium]|nr:hypothetical protein [Gemmatimonadota bacterium]
MTTFSISDLLNFIHYDDPHSIQNTCSHSDKGRALFARHKRNIEVLSEE